MKKLLNQGSRRIILIVFNLRKKKCCHFPGTPLCFFRLFTTKVLINYCGPKVKPSIKMCLVYGKFCMWRKRAAEIGLFFQKNGLPEPVHFFQVLWPFILNDCIKNRGKQRVSFYLSIKLIYYQFYIV